MSHAIALERFKLGVDARKKQRDREKSALEFQVPEKQWPSDVRDSRKGQIVAGVPIPARPTLSIPSLEQPIRLVLNQEKAAQLGVQIHPISEEANDETAEILQGLYRRIEVDSRAGLARSFAYERGVKCGTGEYEITTEYDPDGGSKFDQKIVIKRLLFQGSIVRDPFAQEPDWSDGLWAFKPTDLQFDAYKRKYSKSKLAEYDSDQLDALAEEHPEWITGDGAGRAIRIAGYYEIRVKTRTVVLCSDGSEQFDDEIPAGVTVLTGDKARSCEYEDRKLWYSVINALEELEPPQERDGRYIPLIPYVGVELIPFDGERRWMGITEPNMDAVRLINYSASNAVEMAALEPRAPWMIAEGQDEGHEQEFIYANIRNLHAIHYKPTSLLGQPVGPPQRVQADVSRLGPSMMLLQQAREFLHSGTGAFEAALGQASPQNKTKGGVLALQQQHDQGNSHFLDNLAEITMTYEAKVNLDLIPHIYDRPGRLARILGKEDERTEVMLNHPFMPDPVTKRPKRLPYGTPEEKAATDKLVADPNHPAKHYDLKKGRYGVTVSIGKSYKSRTEQGADELGQLFQAEPQLFAMLGDIYLKFRDFPGHLEAAERVKKMLPPQLQDQQGNPEQELGQLKGQVQQMGEQLKQAAEMIKTEEVKHRAQVQIAQFQAAMDVKLKAMEDATKIAVAKINAMTKGIASANEAEDEAIALDRKLAAEANQATHDRAHELGVIAEEHKNALAQAQQGLDHALMQGEQGQAHALEQGEQGQENALEQGQQAADLAPEPGTGE